MNWKICTLYCRKPRKSQNLAVCVVLFFVNVIVAVLWLTSRCKLFVIFFCNIVMRMPMICLTTHYALILFAWILSKLICIFLCDMNLNRVCRKKEIRINSSNHFNVRSITNLSLLARITFG